MTTTPKAALLSEMQRRVGLILNCAKHGQHESALAILEQMSIYLQSCSEEEVKLQATQADPVQAGGLPDERAAFEQWASDNGEFPRAVARSGDVYHLMATQTYWLAWQARAALSACKPFTNAQIERLFYNSNRGNGCASLAAFVRVVRLVESAHGIGLEVKP